MADDLRVSVSIGASLAASFGSVVGRSRRQVVELGRAVERSERTARRIDGFRALERAVDETRAAHAAARAETDRTRQALVRARNPTDALRRAHRNASQEARRLSGELARQKRELAGNRRSLQAAGVAVDRLDRDEARLGRTIRAQKRHLADTNRLLERREAIIARRGNLRGAMVGATAVGYAAGRAFGSVVGEAVEFESKMADVRKVVNFENPTQFKQMGRDLLAMSKRVPLGVSGLADIAASAGQAGIARGEILRFTEDAAKVGVAFDISGREAGSAMTGLRTIFKLNQNGVVDLAGAYNHLSNNMDATAPAILNIANRAGSTAEMFGLDGKELGALGATFLALKTPPEVAATGINAMLVRLQNATKQGPKFRQALDDIGMSAEDMQDRIATNAQGTLLGVLEAIADADDASGVLFDLFGQEYADDITKLVGNLDLYRKALGLASSEQAGAASVQKEYEERAKTTANNLQLMRNRLTAAGGSVGNVFLPALNDAVAVVGGMADKAALLAEKYPGATKAGVGLAFGLVALKVAAIGAAWAKTFVGQAAVGAALRLGNLRLALLAVGTGFRAAWGRAAAFGTALAALPGRLSALGVAGSASAALHAVGRAMTTAAAATRVFTLALLTNPIGWIGLAIAGVAIAIVKFWQPIKAFFGGLWAGIREGFGPVGESFGQLRDMIGGLLEPIEFTEGQLAAVAAAGKVVGTVLGGALRMVFGVVVGTIRGLVNLGRVIWHLVQGNWSEAWEAGKDFVEGVKSDAGQVADGAKTVGSAFAGSPTAPKLPGVGRAKRAATTAAVVGASVAAPLATAADAGGATGGGAVFPAAEESSGGSAAHAGVRGGPTRSIAFNAPVASITIQTGSTDPEAVAEVVERKVIPRIESAVREMVEGGDDVFGEDDG